MTAVVAFLCTDGVVVAADSMLTSSMGGMPVAHHKGKKVGVLNGQQVFAFSGDQGLGARFRIMADSSHTAIAEATHPLDYPLELSRLMLKQFQSTGITGSAIDLNTVLAYVHGGEHHCCMFEGLIQPRLLDKDHFYASLGSGMFLADPFLRFLVDVFCQTGPPSLYKGSLLAVWAIDYVIQTNPGGVAGPIRVGTLEHDDQGAISAREHSDTEIEGHRQAVEGILRSLQDWRASIKTGAAAGDDLPPFLKPEEE